LESCRRSFRVCRIICIQSDCGVCEHCLMPVEREQMFPFSSWKITSTNEVRSYVFYLFGYFWEDHECFVGSMEKLAEKAALTMMQSMREWQATHPCQRIARKFEEVGYIMIMHGSRLDLDMMHSWKESSCCKTGRYVSSFHHWIPSPKKITSNSWYLVCIYAHGMISLNCSDDEILETNCLDFE
jgi:hypothetical protein